MLATFSIVDEKTGLVLDTVYFKQEHFLGGGLYGSVWQAESNAQLPWVIKREKTVAEINSVLHGSSSKIDPTLYPEQSDFSNEVRIFRHVYGPMSAHLFEERHDRHVPRQLVMLQIPGYTLNDSSHEQFEVNTVENYVNVILSLLYSIQNLHKMGVIHGDLTINNMLVERKPDGFFFSLSN